MEVVSGAEPGRRVSRISDPKGALRVLASIAILIAVLVALWEGYKALGAASGGMIPFTAVELPISPYDTSMPHVWDIVTTLFAPAQRGGDQSLLALYVEAALFTAREVLLGFAIGSAFGFALAVLFVVSAPVERGLMPYVIASQTVPLLAIAPMVVIWGGQIGWPSWVSVSLISAYLSFFPVTINTVRGLRSPPASAVELMRSYAATRTQLLWKLQVPASLPYLFTALKLAATASVVGAIIGELPAGLSVGLGRSLLRASYFFGTAPENLFGAVIVAALLGMATFGLVTLAEHLLVPQARRVEG
jgi:NitT/TauT family transport system permease protein